MNILHINMNYDKSKIHHNIVEALNKNTGVDGRIFFPVVKTDNRKVDANFVDQVKCLNKYDRWLYKHRNNKLTKIAEKKYNISEYSCILAHSLFSNGLVAMTISKKTNTPYTVIVTNTDMNIYFKKLRHLRKTGIKILKNAEKIIFSSPAYLEELRGKYITEEDKDYITQKSIVIPFGIDKFWIDNKHKMEQKELVKEIKILYVGKINKNKNIITTLNACKKLKEQGIDVKYTVIGEVQNDEGKKILDEIKHHKFVEYISQLPFEELISYYRSNDIFIMPSYAESFGLVYAEAMSQGLPIIYTKGQGFDGHFKNYKVGISVKADSVEEIISAIEYIIKNYNTISTKCYEEVEVFSWQKIAAKFIQQMH